MSKYVVKLFEHELHGRFVVNMFVALYTYESRGIINFMFQCVEDLVSCILMHINLMRVNHVKILIHYN
jgi:hypothetical protein